MLYTTQDSYMLLFDCNIIVVFLILCIHTLKTHCVIIVQARIHIVNTMIIKIIFIVILVFSVINIRCAK